MLIGDLKKGIGLGFLAGVTSGLFTVALNKATGVFPFESGLLANLVTFSIGGAVFGVVVGAFMSAIGWAIPFTNPILKTISISGGLWLLLRLFGFLLSLNSPERYHGDLPQAIQGFILALFLGAVLGMLWKGTQDKTA